MKRLIARCAGMVLVVVAAGCADVAGPADIPIRDDVEFTGVVLPTLLRDCGFSACHGSHERFFRVYGPGRTRFNPLVTKPLDELDGYERDFSKTLTLSMIDPRDPERSLLLRKPLAVEAGGASHEGVDKYGRNVYRTPDDEGYITLARWVYNIAPTLLAAPQP